MLASIRPQSHTRYLLLPILGAALDEFTAWSNRRGYPLGTIRNQLKDSRLIDAYLQKDGARGLHDLTHGSFERAWAHFRQRRPSTAGTIRQIERFLEETRELQALPTKPKSFIDLELERLRDYLHHVRGLEFSTIQHHSKYVQGFLEFLGWEENPTALTQVTLIDLERFVRAIAGRLNRYSLQHVIGYMRAFLRFQYEQGILKSPLHTMVDTPRIYRLERLPRHLPWETVKQLLHSIDRTDFFGWRDYAMLHLVAGYGLRGCEVVSLTLDDIDWRVRILRIPQRKTGNQLTLPLTDAAGDVLVQYLQKRNPELPYREAARPFSVRIRGKGRNERICPIWPETARLLREHMETRGMDPREKVTVFVNRLGQPLTRFGVRYILSKHLQKAASLRPSLADKRLHPHSMRHSTAIHLLKSGVDLSTIANWLGHASVNTTNKYASMDLEMKRRALEKARPLTEETPEQGRWHRDPDILAWLESL
jgi:integrase/recombinase XerD